MDTETRVTAMSSLACDLCKKYVAYSPMYECEAEWVALQAFDMSTLVALYTFSSCWSFCRCISRRQLLIFLQEEIQMVCVLYFVSFRVIYVGVSSDRQMPSCSFCRRTANGCTYPTARLKPGPKLGK